MGDEEERRRTPRYYLVSRVDVVVAGSGDPLWGAIANISRTGTTLYIRQTLKPRIKVTLRFRFQAAGGREVIEDVNATLVWQRGETVGMDLFLDAKAFTNGVSNTRAAGNGLLVLPFMSFHFIEIRASCKRPVVCTLCEG
ncbi:MAG: PilZ domain-containing protein [Nitrospirae bacterium]|nr:MAG: PilZ domain-containing protein [Nitrospirota bacterium]